MVVLVLGLLAVFWPWNPGNVRPVTVNQTLIFWAVLSVIFLLTVVLSWILVRESIDIYVERHTDRVGSHIKTKLVVGAVALSVMPVCFLVAFNYGVINRNIATWFRAPASNDLQAFKDAADLLVKEMGDETQAQAELLAAQPDTRQLLLGGSSRSATFLQGFLQKERTEAPAAIFPLNQKVPIGFPGDPTPRKIRTPAPWRSSFRSWTRDAPSVPSPSRR